MIRALRELATRVETERQTGATAITFSGARLRDGLTIVQDGPRAGELLVTGEFAWTAAQYAHAAVLLDRIAQFAGVAAANVAALDGGTALAPVDVPEAEEPSEPPALLAPLRSLVGHDSLVLRHAFRVGIVHSRHGRGWRGANRDYLRTVVSIFADRGDAAGRLMRARRRDAALAAINAEESFQRLIAERGGSTETLERA